MTADRYTVTFFPSPEPPPPKIVVRETKPYGKAWHLSVDEAAELRDALDKALKDYLESPTLE